MHCLPPHPKQLAHLCHGEELSRSLFLIEAQQSGMHQLAQRPALPLRRQAKPVRSQWIAVEAASKKGDRASYIALMGVRIALDIMSNGGQMSAKQAVPQ